jgi:hypothetical protein
LTFERIAVEIGIMARPLRIEYAGALYHVMKGQKEKQVLAWWLHGRTTVTRRWIAEHLKMGYETRVSQAVGWVESAPTREVLEIRKKLTENTI